MTLTEPVITKDYERVARATVSPLVISAVTAVGLAVLLASDTTIFGAAALAALVGGWSSAWSP